MWLRNFCGIFLIREIIWENIIECKLQALAEKAYSEKIKL